MKLELMIFAFRTPLFENPAKTSELVAERNKSREDGSV